MSTPRTPLTGPFRLAGVLVHPELNRITNGGGEIRVEPRAMDLLVYLAERFDTVCSRRELLDHVWDDAIVGEEVLTQAVSKLRRALGDRPRSPRYIETIARRGYRLLVAPSPCEGSGNDAIRAGDDGGTGNPARRPVSSNASMIAAAAMLLLVMDGRIIPPRVAPEVPPVRVVPVTSARGVERYPRFSPDGTRVAFVAHQAGRCGVYVIQPGDGPPVELVSGPSHFRNPAWSPDGTRVAFVQRGRIMVVPGTGGAPRVMTPARNVTGRISWAPDGRTLVCAERAPGGDGRGGVAGARLVSYAVASGERIELTAARQAADDLEPIHSEDGRVAFLRRHASGLVDLLVLEDGKPPVRVAAGFTEVCGFDWTRDGKGIVVSGRIRGICSVWRVDVSTAAMRWIPASGSRMADLDVSPRGDRIVFSDYRVDTDIRRIRFRGVTPEVSTVVQSSYADHSPEVSPDGGRIAFISDRSGEDELWMSSADGSSPCRLTDCGCACGSPYWSRDGTRVLFSARRGDTVGLQIVDTRTGECSQVYAGSGHAFARGWSPDDNWVYYCSASGDAYRLHLGSPGISRIPSRAHPRPEVVYAIEPADSGAVLTMRRSSAVPALRLMRIDDAADSRVCASADGHTLLYTARADSSGNLMMASGPVF